MNIHELDINKVEVGQKVEVTADSLEDQTFTGTVTKVNINGTASNGITTYPVTIRLDGTGEELPAAGTVDRHERLRQDRGGAGGQRPVHPGGRSEPGRKRRRCGAGGPARRFE